MIDRHLHIFGLTCLLLFGMCGRPWEPKLQAVTLTTGIESQFGRDFSSESKWSRISNLGLRVHLQLPTTPFQRYWSLIAQTSEAMSSSRFDAPDRKVSIHSTKSHFYGLGTAIHHPINHEQRWHLAAIVGRSWNSLAINASSPNVSRVMKSLSKAPGTYALMELAFTQKLQDRLTLGLGGSVRHHKIDYKATSWDIAIRTIKDKKLSLNDTIIEEQTQMPQQASRTWYGLHLEVQLEL